MVYSRLLAVSGRSPSFRTALKSKTSRLKASRTQCCQCRIPLARRVQAQVVALSNLGMAKIALAVFFASPVSNSSMLIETGQAARLDRVEEQDYVLVAESLRDLNWGTE